MAQKIADRDWLDASGNALSTGSPDVSAVRYKFLANGGEVVVKFGDSPTLDRQFWAMGALTKLGNVINTVVNDDAYDGRDPMPELVEWLTAATGGQWREPGEGVARGPKYDKDLLAEILVRMLGAKAAGDQAHYRTKLDDKSYYAKVRANTGLMAEYAKEIAGRAPAGDVGGLA